MDALFFISIACFFALFVAALAIARHVRIEGMGRGRDAAARPTAPKTRRLQIHAVPDRRPVRVEHRWPAEQTLGNLAQQKQPDWRFLVSGERRKPDTSLDPELRKPPASARSERRQRPDWAHYNKDLGDLSDPYQPPLTRAAGGSRRSTLLALPRKDAS